MAGGTAVLNVPAEKKPSSYANIRFNNREVPNNDTLAKFVEGSSGSIFADPASNQVILRDVALPLIDAIKQLDITREVLRIDCVVLLAVIEDGSAFSVDWLVNAGGLNLHRGLDAGAVAASGSASGYSLGLQTGALEIVLNGMVKSGSARVISRPTLTVASGELGKISSGREVPIPIRSQNSFQATTSVDYRKVALQLEFTPRLVGEEVWLKLTQKNDQIAGVAKIDSNEIPIIQVQALESTLRLPLGRWLTCGSVVVDTVDKNSTRVPWVRYLPILGNLLGSTGVKAGRVEVGVICRITKGPADSLELTEPEPLNYEPGFVRQIDERPEIGIDAGGKSSVKSKRRRLFRR